MRPDSDVLHKSFTYLYAALIIGRSFPGQRSQEATKPGSVSYTHLTLPTILRV